MHKTRISCSADICVGSLPVFSSYDSLLVFYCDRDRTVIGLSFLKDCQALVSVLGFKSILHERTAVGEIAYTFNLFFYPLSLSLIGNKCFLSNFCYMFEVFRTRVDAFIIILCGYIILRIRGNSVNYLTKNVPETCSPSQQMASWTRRHSLK